MATLQENNELIARFMGWPFEGKYTTTNPSRFDKWLTPHYVYWATVNRFQFHTSWDWLIPVIVRCVEIKYNTRGVGEWQYGLGNRYNDIYIPLNNFDLLGAHEKVVQFIKWYNSQPKN